jgi:hypothetical protein
VRIAVRPAAFPAAYVIGELVFEKTDQPLAATTAAA